MSTLKRQLADGTWEYIQTSGSNNTEIDEHILDKENPHDVTKEQIGLSNVDDEKQATKAEFDAHIDEFYTHKHDVEDIAGLTDGSADIYIDSLEVGNVAVFTDDILSDGNYTARDSEGEHFRVITRDGALHYKGEDTDHRYATSNELDELSVEMSNGMDDMENTLSDHSLNIASDLVLGHVKVGANLTIEADGTLNASAGDSYALTDESVTKLYEGNLDLLIESGYYYHMLSAENAPTGGKGSLRVLTSGDGFIEQVWTTDNNVITDRYSWSRVGKITNGVAVWNKMTNPIGSSGGWKILNFRLNDTLTSTSTTEAATANVIKQLNDKMSASPIAITPLAPFIEEYTGAIRCFRNGYIQALYVDVRTNTTLSVAGHVLCNLPVGYRPNVNLVGHLQVSTVSPIRYIPVSVNGNGQVIVQNPLSLPTGNVISGYVFFTTG